MNTNEFFETLGLTKINFQLFLLSLGVIILGYVLMALGKTYDVLSLYISPIILTIGYVVILPLSFLYKKRNSEE